MIPVTLTAGGSALERIFERGRAAVGDARIEVARRTLADLEPERRAVAAAIATDRPGGLDALADLAERAFADYRARVKAKSARTPLGRLHHRVDRAIDTTEPEYMDQAEVSEDVRRRLIEDLAVFNRLVRAYPTFTALLAPHIDAAAARAPGRSVRLLELGSGHGDLALHLARWALRRGLPVEVTGSDIADDYVRIGDERARAAGLPVRYVRVNALDIEAEAGAYDVVFNTQSLHHFSPGQIARIFAEATRAGKSAVFIDGERSLPLLAFVGAATRALFSRAMNHDAIVSCRRFLDYGSLLLLAALGPASARARVSSRFPAYSVVEFPA